MRRISVYLKESLKSTFSSIKSSELPSSSLNGSKRAVKVLQPSESITQQGWPQRLASVCRAQMNEKPWKELCTYSGERRTTSSRVIHGVATRLTVGFVVAICMDDTEQTVPYTGRIQRAWWTTETEKSLGEEALQKVLAKVKEDGTLVPQSSSAAYQVKSIGMDIDFQWEFFVLTNNRIAQGYSCPGGKILVTTAMVDKMDRAELAAVLSHECGHVLARHAAERSPLLVLAELAELAIACFCFHPLAMCLVYLGFHPISFIFGDLWYYQLIRKQEDEADFIGLMLMAQAGYDPAAMVTMLEKLQPQERHQQSIGESDPDDLPTRSHPTTAHRIECIQRNLPAAVMVYNEQQRHRLDLQKTHQAPESTWSLVGWKLFNRANTKNLTGPTAPQK